MTYAMATGDCHDELEVAERRRKLHTCLNGLRADFFRDLLQSLAHLPVVFRAFPPRTADSSTYLSLSILQLKAIDDIKDVPFSPVLRLRSSSSSVRILPPWRTSHGARAKPCWRAMGKISRSKSRSKTLHAPW